MVVGVEGVNVSRLSPVPRSAGFFNTARRCAVASGKYVEAKRSEAKLARRGSRLMTARRMSRSLDSRNCSQQRTQLSHINSGSWVVRGAEMRGKGER